MAAPPTKITIDVTGMDTVRDALARREAKIFELQEIIKDEVCSNCNIGTPGTECNECGIYDALQWDGEQA